MDALVIAPLFSPPVAHDDARNAAVVAQGGFSSADSTDEDDSRDYEAEARGMGWRPKGEFKGDPRNWKDAKSYVEDGGRYVGLLRAENKRLTEDIEKRAERVKQASHHAKPVRYAYLI